MLVLKYPDSKRITYTNKGMDLMIQYSDILEIMKRNRIKEELIHELKDTVTLEEAEFDSLDLMMLLHEISNKYDIELKLNRSNTFEQIVGMVNSKLS